MEGIIRFLSQKLMSPGADQHIGGLDADDHAVIIALLDHSDLIQGTLHQSFRSDTAVFFHEILLQGAAVDSDADGNITLFCAFDDSFDLVAPADIAGVDPDFVGAVFHGHNGHSVVKVNVRDKRDMNPLFNLTDRSGSFFGGAGAADDLTARLLKPKGLFHCGFDIFSGCICHGLDQDGISAAYYPVADLYYFCMFAITHNYLLSEKR